LIYLRQAAVAELLGQTTEVEQAVLEVADQDPTHQEVDMK
jgi:hypothetical protein